MGVLGGRWSEPCKAGFYLIREICHLGSHHDLGVVRDNPFVALKLTQVPILNGVDL